MKIEQLRLRHVFGSLAAEHPFWEERLVMPLDVYAEFRSADPELRPNSASAGGRPGRIDLNAVFLQVETDDGVHGIAGPMHASVATIIAAQLRPLLVGRDPLAHEFLWDIMHRSLVHGRQGEAMMAISAVDCALWDLKGRHLGVPVYQLIGGPTRTEMPAYASMLGFDVTDMGKVRERALWAQSQGYKAQKWFFRHGPMWGADGLALNIELVRTLRDALGDDDEIMLDCWQSMDVSYVVRLAERIGEYRPRWLEEVCMPDRVESYARLRDSIDIPLAGAEHEYTRWGFKRFIDAGALDVLQPDIYWAGGLTEVLKIAALGTTHDLITIPHGHSTLARIHLSVTQSPIHTPWQEYLLKWNEVQQMFLLNPLRPVDGLLHLPEAPGLNMELNPARIEREEQIG